MPTGYTYRVQNGEITELADYAKECAKAFLVCMRDTDGKELPETVEPSTYYRDQLADAIAHRDKLVSMTVDQRAKAHADAMECDRAAYQERLARNAIERDRYEAMIEKVRSWEPPDSHSALKDFMLSQLRVGREHDVLAEGQIDRYWKPKPITRDQWHAKAVADAAADVARYEDEWQKEVQRAANQTEFIRALNAAF